jgi:lysyl-tRNA synthetase class 2
VIPLAASISEAYRDGIVDTGREPQFLFLVAFLLTFGFIRTSTHMIRAGVAWWPGNVSTKGGTHIHHMVFGIITIMVVGWAAVTGGHLGDPWQGIAAVLFGIGTGLTLDEYALWLNLKDVYWEKQGRASIDAVIVAASLAGLVLVGLRGWIDAADDVENFTKAVVAAVGLFGIVVFLINAAKEKFGFALLTVPVPLVGLIGAVRLANPRSLWARAYRKGRKVKAEERYAGEAGKPFWKRRGSLRDRFAIGLGLGRGR